MASLLFTLTELMDLEGQLWVRVPTGNIHQHLPFPLASGTVGLLLLSRAPPNLLLLYRDWKYMHRNPQHPLPHPWQTSSKT
jgi:hypothetical protein